jgi:hypothetical protein
MQLPRRTLITALIGGATIFGSAANAGDWGPHRGPAGVSIFDTFDTNDDGKLTQAEVDAARKAQLTKFDTDGNGQLTLAEYQALWADAMRRAMVRQFQANDADGNGSITVEEFTVRFEDVVQDFDRNDDAELTRDEIRPHGRWSRHGPGRDGPEGRQPGDDD